MKPAGEHADVQKKKKNRHSFFFPPPSVSLESSLCCPHATRLTSQTAQAEVPTIPRHSAHLSATSGQSTICLSIRTKVV